jgi:hypothetical protein
LLPLHNGSIEAADWEVDIEIMEIAHARQITLETLPAAVPYLDVPSAPRLSERFSIGLVAQSGNWDPRRSVPRDLFACLAMQPGVALFNLQPGSRLEGAADASAEDVLLTASRVRALDLVMTVDTMMAHLAGALGAPTWTLLSSDADWRWMDRREDSPWYPTMRLFRQTRPGEWADVLARVRAALDAWLLTRSSRAHRA